MKMLSDEELNDYTKLINAKREISGKQKFLIDKKVISALIYSGALDYFQKSRDELATIYSIKRKSELDIISDIDGLKKAEEYYRGYSLLKRQKLEKVREFLSNKGHLTIEDLDGKSNKSAIECVLIKSIVSKETKDKKRPYRVATIESLNDTYSSIFIWDKKIELEKDVEYMCKLTKEGNFIKIIEACRIDKL